MGKQVEMPSVNFNGIGKWVYANMASQYLKEGGEINQVYANEALKEFGKLDIYGPDAEPLKKDFESGSPEATKKLAEIYSAYYEQEMLKAKVSDFKQIYSSVLNKLSPEQKELFEKEFDKHGGETFAEVYDKMIDAQTIMQKVNVKGEEKEKAQKTIQKYQFVRKIKDTLDEYQSADIKRKVEPKGLEKILTAQNGQMAA